MISNFFKVAKFVNKISLARQSLEQKRSAQKKYLQKVARDNISKERALRLRSSHTINYVIDNSTTNKYKININDSGATINNVGSSGADFPIQHFFPFQ